MPKSYIGGFEKIKKRNNKNLEDDYNPKNNDKHKNKRPKKSSLDNTFLEDNEVRHNEYS